MICVYLDWQKIMKKKEIRSINYFKALLVISVIFAHLAGRYSDFMPLYVINRLGNGGFAVTCFFVLSGFLAGRTSNKDEKYHIKDS